MKVDELAERVRHVIRNNRYLNIATHSATKVWCASLAYYVEPDYSFVYYSGKSALHSEHISTDPLVAVTIYDSSLSSDEVDGIQFSARVSRVPARELPTVAPKYFVQSFPIEEIRKRWVRSIEDFKGLADQRFYRIEPLDMFTIDLESIKVDKRVAVELEILRSAPMNK